MALAIEAAQTRTIKLSLECRMQMESLQELYVDELKDIYSAEKQILKALPKMIKAATHPELKDAFATHRDQTEGHVARLERIFNDLDQSPRGKKCKGMEGVIEEGAELLAEKPAPDVLDAGLISAAQRVEHYEIAAYGTVRTWATQLGREQDASLLEQTLGEEKETDELLTRLAEESINLDAENPSSDREVSLGASDERGGGTSKTGRQPASKRPTSERAPSRR
jgi:ferritin-like metal-binding protein YciE